MLISQGELGVMHPHNAATVKYMATYGACPCVILGISKGSTTILAHIHRANSLARLAQQLDDILGDALPVHAPVKAFLSTERYEGRDPLDERLQREILDKLTEMLAKWGVRNEQKSLPHSAVKVTHEKIDFYKDEQLVRTLSPQANHAYLMWAMAYDQHFGKKTNEVPMAIRVGVNAESPQTAMARMFK